VNPNDPNIKHLEIVAARLQPPLREQLVFVGGSIAGLLITDPATPAIRATEDVDLICHASAHSDYYQIENALRANGFVQDVRPGAPICRWRVWHGVTDVSVDVMPTLAHILGFSNRWYPLALDTAQTFPLPSGQAIRLITATVFVATKIEAFHGRGNRNYLTSHDLEDVIAVIDGRADHEAHQKSRI